MLVLCATSHNFDTILLGSFFHKLNIFTDLLLIQSQCPWSLRIECPYILGLKVKKGIIFGIILQSKLDSFAIGNNRLTLFEMINHCPCNINFTCTRYMIRSRSNNDSATVSTFLLNNILLSQLLNMCGIIFDDSAVAIIVTFIFHHVNINRARYVIIVVLTPDSILVRVSNIMAFVGTLWKMHNKHK